MFALFVFNKFFFIPYHSLDLAAQNKMIKKKIPLSKHRDNDSFNFFYIKFIKHDLKYQ